MLRPWPSLPLPLVLCHREPGGSGSGGTKYPDLFTGEAPCVLVALAVRAGDFAFRGWGLTPPPPVFSAKSAQGHETKEVELLKSAKSAPRVRKVLISGALRQSGAALLIAASDEDGCRSRSGLIHEAAVAATTEHYTMRVNRCYL